MRAALISLEPWDDVWRRNQHLASRLAATSIISELLFIEPPASGFSARARQHDPVPGITVLTPPLVIPRRYGGQRAVHSWMRRAVRGVDLIWINDPVSGVAARPKGSAAVYDITDDWRELDQQPRRRRQIIAAEDALAQQGVPSIACSTELQRRWAARYGINATVIANGFDSAHLRSAKPVAWSTPGPQVVYVGTLHRSRLDVELLVDLAAAPLTVHLVGPDHLSESDRQLLRAAGVQRHGPVASERVPDWLVSADVLICPHLVDPFTLSLDAIKAHEYLATDRPVVATRSSGFQGRPETAGLDVVERAAFVETVLAATRRGAASRPRGTADWDEQAARFAKAVHNSVC
jgi:teichuronic acid biosynthesis glycosyltransferase TuaH